MFCGGPPPLSPQHNLHHYILQITSLSRVPKGFTKHPTKKKFFNIPYLVQRPTAALVTAEIHR